MAVSNWTEADTIRARQIWEDYQKQHDVSQLKGKAVGIDPLRKRVWFGESALDIVDKMNAEGIDTPIYCVRVGSDYYVRKGGHR